MAKTPLSLTGDPSIKGAPRDFVLKISNISISVGAGFVIPIVGEVFILTLPKSIYLFTQHTSLQISRMPGLPTRPAIYDIDLNTETGEIEGLF